jgi:hypothetical protein
MSTIIKRKTKRMNRRNDEGRRTDELLNELDNGKGKICISLSHLL